MVIPSDHESKIAVEERRAVNTRQGEWQMQKKKGTKEYHCRTASPYAEWDEDDDMFLIYFLTELLLCVRFQVMWVGIE